jgi:hypothetical protein
MHQMSFPVSGLQLRLSKEQNKQNEIEDRITNAIESISESVVCLAGRRDHEDNFLIADRRFVLGLTAYQIDKIVKGLRSNFPDCIVMYADPTSIMKGSQSPNDPAASPNCTFIIDWDERHCRPDIRDKMQKSFA